MPEARERKKADKIKEKSDRRVSPVKKTMRRRMTAKLQKELMEQKQGRESDSGLDMTPETQAAVPSSTIPSCSSIVHEYIFD